MNNRSRQIKKQFGPYRCHWCQYRYSDCKYGFGNKPNYCKDFVPGGCLTCKYHCGKNSTILTDEETDQWYRRGCNTFYPSSLRCKGRKRLSRKRKKILKNKGLL